MEVYIYTLVSVFIVSLISVVGILIISLREHLLHKILFILVSVAAGTLFGGALLHLIPEAFEESTNPTYVSLFILLGIMAFFSLEKFLKWKHSHEIEDSCTDCVDEKYIKTLEPENTPEPVGHLVLISDGVHNFIDGVVIAASYLISIEVGIATTIAIAVHEIPQEISDFAVLVHAGFSKFKALMMNFVSALSAVVGAVVVLIAGNTIESALPAIAAFAAGSFLYIAGSDLVPEIHKTSHPGRSAIQFFSILAGIAIMFGLLFL